MLQSRAATCNGFETSLQSLHEVKSSSIAGVAMGRLQRVICPLCNLSHNYFMLATR